MRSNCQSQSAPTVLPWLVTVLIRRRVKRGAEAAYQTRLQTLQSDARLLADYMGVTTQRPPPGTVAPQPSSPRMALVMVGMVFTLILVIGSTVNAVFARLQFDTPYPKHRTK